MQRIHPVSSMMEQQILVTSRGRQALHQLFNMYLILCLYDSCYGFLAGLLQFTCGREHDENISNTLNASSEKEVSWLCQSAPAFLVILTFPAVTQLECVPECEPAMDTLTALTCNQQLIQNVVCLVEVKDEVQLTHVAKVAVQHLHKMVDDLKDLHICMHMAMSSGHV